jgi:hypothetical protein
MRRIAGENDTKPGLYRGCKVQVAAAGEESPGRVAASSWRVASRASVDPSPVGSNNFD